MNTTFDHQKRSPNKSMSSSKQQVIRVFGQRSIPSTFLSRSSIRPIDGGECLKKGRAPARESPVTLSDFLDRKLQKGSVLPRFVQGKRRPFSSPATGVVASGSNEGQNNGNKSDSKCGFDIAFEQLKHTRKENSASVCFPADGEDESSTIQDTQGSRKRRKSEVGDGTQSARKVLVTLGDNPKSARKTINNSFISNKKPMPQYNHYANGSGWWDSNMEGVDNEEVGCHEVWEGVGSTTLGGLEWH